MFIGIGSFVVCSAALILFQKPRGLLVFAASSLACNPAVALRFFVFFCLVRALYSLFALQKLFSVMVQSGCFLHTFG